jgi:hypothetical protein
MSLHGYHYSRKLALDDAPLESLIFAAIRKADSDNLMRLGTAFPELIAEMKMRYNARLGVIPSDGDIDLELLAKQVNDMLYPKERDYAAD